MVNEFQLFVEGQHVASLAYRVGTASPHRDAIGDAGRLFKELRHLQPAWPTSNMYCRIQPVQP